MEEEMKAFVKAMMAGDERAFDEIYHSYSKKLYRMAYFITGNHSDSEDVLQETFVKCYLHRGSLKNPERFESWIYQILVRTAWKLEKRKKRAGEISYEGVLEQEDASGARAARQLCEDFSAPNPLEVFLQKESQTEIGQMVKQLDIKYRTVVMLYYYNGLGVKEIAQIMGIFEGTVKSRLSKARSLLHRKLENQMDTNQEGRQNHQVKGAVL
ncbi:MAG: RNA polymerase sigma factor [Lachnospiraceae bacterium]|nr:RNA polymerase sigma factor [Lachnospiraceae bacterium]